MIRAMTASWKQLSFQILLLFVSWRHSNTNTSGSTPPPEVPVSLLPTDARRVVLKGESHTERLEVADRVKLELECTWTGDQNQLPNMIGLWRKDGHDVENSRLTVHLENEQYHLKRAFNIVNEEDFGNYSCMFGSDAKIDFVLTAPQMIEARDKPIIGYVGDSVVIACKMGETKPKPSTWIWYKANGTDKEQIVAAAEPHRYEIKNKERETKLLVHNLTEADSGSYFCDAVYPISTTMGHLELRVITFHEPLKPFIAIAVEVTFLVAAILLYEKIWSKKDSAAGDGANDQPNTVTLGENCGSEGGSSMRQRKV